jgi:hypothetical protein
VEGDTRRTTAAPECCRHQQLVRGHCDVGPSTPLSRADGPNLVCRFLVEVGGPNPAGTIRHLCAQLQQQGSACTHTYTRVFTGFSAVVSMLC